MFTNYKHNRDRDTFLVHELPKEFTLDLTELATAMEPKRCANNDVLLLFLPLQVDPSKSFDSLGKFSYDAPNMRTRFIEEVDESQQRSFYDELFLFREVSSCRCCA